MSARNPPGILFYSRGWWWVNSVNHTGFAAQTYFEKGFQARIQIDDKICLDRISVRELNDALLWLTIEGAPGSIDVQARLSAFALEPSKVQEFGKIATKIILWRSRPNL